MGKNRTPDWLARLFRGTKPVGRCIIWTKGKTDKGYGTIRKDGRSQVVHRVAYEAQNGPIPPGLILDHLCRNRACLNPSHLEAVTHRINILRGNGAPAQNARKNICSMGHSLLSKSNVRRRRTGGRACRACCRASNIRYRVRKGSQND